MSNSYYTTRYNSSITFKGIDESSPKFQTSTSRAIDLLNYTYRDNCIQKRFGTKPSFDDIGEVYYYYTASDSTIYASQKSSTPIYDMWWLEDTLIIHKGVLLFKWKIGDEKASVITSSSVTKSQTVDNVTHTYVSVKPMPDKHFGGVTHNGYLWLFTGNGYYRYSEDGGLKRVVDTSCYTPTTTIGITSNSSGLGTRSSLDNPNLLNKFRKNELVGIAKDSASIYIYPLDANIQFGMYPNISVEVETTTPEVETMTPKLTNFSDRESDTTEYYLLFPNAGTTINIPVWGKKAKINSKALPFVFWAKDSSGRYHQETHYLGDSFINLVDSTGSTFLVTTDSGNLIGPDTDGLGKFAYIKYGKTTIKTATAIRFIDISNSSTTLEPSVTTSCKISDYFGTNKTYLTSYGSGFPLWAWFVSIFNCPDNYSPLMRINSLTTKIALSLNDNVSTTIFDKLGDYITISVNDTLDYTRSMTLKCGSYDALDITDKAFMNAPYPQVDGISYFLYDNTAKIIYGYLTESSVCLFTNLVSPVDGEGNIIITFPSLDSYHPDNIEQCTFGILYGASNLKNRLFLSGNSELPNYDWHSGEDFTYFYEDTDTPMAYGTSSNAVCGYSIISDGTLLVLKTPSDSEPTIYYRKTATSSVTDDSGSTENYVSGTPTKTIFPLVTTNAKDGGIAYNLVTEYNGDTLYVDERGRIVGLDSTGSTADERRVVSTRSSTIDRAIKQEKDNATLYCLYDDNEYVYYGTHNYLYVGCVFDSNYEWFKWSIPNVTCLSKHNGVLYYGNKIGEIRQFTPNEYEDKEEYVIQNGEISYSITGTSSVDTSSDFYKIHMLVSDDIEKVITDNNLKYVKNKRSSNAEKLETIYKNRYGDLQEFLPKFNCGDTCTAYNVKLAITMENTIKVSIDKGLFNVKKIMLANWLNGKTCTLASQPNKEFTISIDNVISETNIGMSLGDDSITSNEEIFITFDKIELLVGGTSKVLFYIKDLFEYGVTNRVYIESIDKLVLTGSKAVCSYYLCAPFTANTLTTKKTIWHYSVTQDTYEDNFTRVYRATDSNQLDSLIEANNLVSTKYSYDDYNLSKMAFERMRVPSTKTMFKPISCNFVCFNFISDVAKNSTLTSVEFRYSYATSAFGIK